MDRFAALTAYAAVVETKSFSAAARRLRIAKSAVSRQVSELEAALGVRLINRTTRSLSLTEVGRAYHARVEQILADLAAADRAAADARSAPRGRLKVSAPMSFGFLHLTPALTDFLRLYPGVVIDLVLNDRFVDLIEEGFDVAVRIAKLADASFIAKRLAPARRVICASPGYLQSRGALTTPDDLMGHDCLFNSNLASTQDWRFTGPDGSAWPVTVKGPLNINNGDALRAAVLHGLGLASLPTFIVGADLQAGRLVSVLDAYMAQDLAISALYPHSRHLSPTVRAFVDFLSDRFGPRPYWDEPVEPIA
jgi:DNA-binding transcriptional LysR family regulator